jgi:uncharacterized cupredoxin-like copper-binding protein
VIALALAAACTGAAPPRAGAGIQIYEHDFWIKSSAVTVPAGTVAFQVHNDAPATHEFVVVRTDDPEDRLPIASDGISVDEDALTSAGEIADVPSGADLTLALTLAPGRYVFFCNMEGHYLGGMHGELEVTADA